MIDTAWTPYCGSAPDPGAWIERWNSDPVFLAILATTTAAGLMGFGKGADRGRFLAAMGVLAIGFVSPLCALSSALFTARTLHHLLLVLAASPLLALCLPPLRRPRVLAATAVATAVFWAWHAPGLYARALSHDGVYWLMQLSILTSAVWFWAAVRASRAHAAVAALLAAMVLMGLLGALIVFSGEPLYAPHFASTMAWGVTPLEDQQAAGLIMWAPAAAAYLLVALWRINGLLRLAPEAAS
ncbi:cytochrome c oxidase assembly protein [Brevundimonas faecalis]|uniref:Membrane protein n=1 Tax=Brevundimonas faecalis TaxID=947378 RepID=A0ABV2R8R3_9CAUL